MSSELVRVVRCDVCGKEGASEHAVALNGTTWEVDLCPTDSGALEAIQALLEAHGRRAKSKRAGAPNPSSGRTLLEPGAPEPDWMLLARTCPLCGHVASARTSLQSHTNSVHNRGALRALEADVERQFACDKCPEIFDAYGSVIQHQRAHLSSPGAAA